MERERTRKASERLLIMSEKRKRREAKERERSWKGGAKEGVREGMRKMEGKKVNGREEKKVRASWRKRERSRKGR